MANIDSKLNAIKGAIYGADVRTSIADGIETINTEVESTTARQESLENTFEDLVINAGNSNAEIVVARNGEVNLNTRINKIDSSLSDMTNQLPLKADKIYVDTKTQANNLAYKESYSTLALLQSAYPTGDTYNHTVLADGLIYTYANSTWTSTGVQANGTGIADKSITVEKTDFIEISTNLVDKTSIKQNTWFDDTTGEEIYSAIRGLTGFIKVDKNTMYVSNNAQKIGRYNINKEYISNTYITPNIPFNTLLAEYIKVAYTNDNIPTAQLNKGLTTLPYEEFYIKMKSIEIPYTSLKDVSIETSDLADKSITVEKTDFIGVSTNRYNEYKNVEGKAISESTGLIVDSLNWKTNYEFIKVNPSDNITLSGISYICRYDINKNFISSFTVEDENILARTTTMPLNIEYIKAVQHVTHWGIPMQINQGATLLPYEPYGNYIIDAKSNGEIIEDKTYYFAPQELKLPYKAPSDEVYTTYTAEELYAGYDLLMANNPTYITKTLLGYDATGVYPIYEYHFKPTELTTARMEKTLPKILLNSGQHGEEKPAVYALYHMMRAICNNWKTNELLEYMRWNIEIKLIPLQNPWRFINGGLRLNGRNVDLARNFDAEWILTEVGHTYSGPFAFSESESQIMRDWFNANLDAIIYVDHHSAGRGTVKGELVYFLIARQELYNENIEISAKYLIEKMTRELDKDYGLNEADGLIGFFDNFRTPGMGFLYANKLGIPSCTMEIPYSISPTHPNYDADTLKAGYELVVNFYLMYINQLKNK